MDFKEVNIDPVKEMSLKDFFLVWIESLPLVGLIVVILLILGVILFTISLKVKNKETKDGLDFLSTLSLFLAFGSALIIGLGGAMIIPVTQPLKEARERINQIEDNAYENILKKYNLTNIPKEDFVFWDKNKTYDKESSLLTTVKVDYSDLEKETAYTLIFDFKENEPILMKTGTVDETIIKSLEK